MDNTQPVLQVNSVTVHVNEKIIINNLTFEVHSGE